MKVSPHHLSDRGFGVDSTIRKQLIKNIDMTKSHDSILESFNRINDLNWMRKEPITIRNIVFNHYHQMKVNMSQKHKSLEEYIDFVKENKLDLFYKVRYLSYQYIGINSSNKNPLYKVMGSPFSLPVYREPTFMLHMLYVKTMLHLYDANVARPMFMDGSWRITPESSDHESDSCFEIYQLAVNHINGFLKYLLSVRHDNPRPLEAKVTVLLNKTPTGEYFPIYSNILASAQSELLDFVLISATIANYKIFDLSMLPIDVATFLDLKDCVQDQFFGYHHTIMTSLTDVPLPDLRELTDNDSVYSSASSTEMHLPEVDPIGNDSVCSTSSEIVENPTVGDSIIQNNISDINNQSQDYTNKTPEINQTNINWGLVVTGIGLIVGGGICVVTGYYPECLSDLFTGGGE